jgi:hypothetical protein
MRCRFPLVLPVAVALAALAAPTLACEGAHDGELDAFLGDWQFQAESTKTVTCGKDASTVHELAGRILGFDNGTEARLVIQGLEVLGAQDLARFCRALSFSVTGTAAAAVAGQSCDDAQEVTDPANQQPATLQTRSVFTALQFMHAGLNGGLNASISQHVEELQNGKSIDAFDCQVSVNAALKKITR